MSDIHTLMEKATAAWNTGALEEARRLSDLLAQALGPEHPGVCLLRGRLAYAGGDRASALALLEQARPHSPGDHILLLQIAELHLKNRAWGPAVDAAAQALALDPPIAGHITATAYLCISARALGKPGEAADAAHALDEVLKRKQLTLDSALANIDTLNAAIAVVTAIGDLPAAQALFISACVKRGEKPRGPIVMSGAASLDQWCAENGVDTTVIEPPVNVALGDEARGFSPAGYVTEPFLAAVVPGAGIFSGWEFAVAPPGTVLGLREIFGADFPPFCHLYSDIAHTAIYYWPPKVIDVPEAALLMPAPFRMHIGHWIVDSLPRLQALAGRADMKVAVPTELPAKHRDFLRFFGIDPSRIINCDLGRRYRFRELLVTQSGTDRRLSPGKVRFVADALRKPRTGAPTRLFLVRDTKTRNIVNQDEVIRTLADFGFERGSLSAMSVDEQRDRLSTADILVTTYGSDLIANYMMQPGTDLIELNWAALDGPAPPSCAFLGIGYHLLMCAGIDTGVKQYKKDSDFVVDCAALRRLIASIIARKAPR